MTENVRKNQVFEAPSAKEQFSQHSAGGLVFEVPSIEVPLPSNGLVYPEGHPLHKKESIVIESMTAKQENILTDRVLMKKGATLTELIRSCLKDKGIDPRKMLMGDRNTIMVQLRGSGYGPDYSALVTCPECGEKSKQQFDLSTLPIKRLQITPVEPYSNLFSFELPQTKAIVKFKFLTGEDEEQVTQLHMAKKKSGLTDGDNITSALLQSVQSIIYKGVEHTDRNQLYNGLRTLPAFDSQALRNFIQNNEPGIGLKGMIECPHCDHTGEVDMPIGANFFWPDS